MERYCNLKLNLKINKIFKLKVSNLTLMALGSSAPEILLSIIEVVGKGFEAGDLGPNTIGYLFNV